MHNIIINNDIIIINEPVFLLKYEVNNVGLTLTYIINQIYYYYYYKFTCKIIIQTELFYISEFMSSTINLLLNMDNIIIINTNKIYQIKKLFFINRSYLPINTNSIKITDMNILINKNNVDYIKFNDMFFNDIRNESEQFFINKIKNLNNLSNSFTPMKI